MLTIYRGSRPLFPLLACQVHLEKDKQACQYIDSILNSAWDWQAEPFKIIGKDETGAIICCVVHGRHGPMYHRALTGISDLFALDAKVIDVDTIINEKASYHLLMATCLDIIRCPGSFWNIKKAKFIATLRSHIAGSR